MMKQNNLQKNRGSWNKREKSGNYGERGSLHIPQQFLKQLIALK